MSNFNNKNKEKDINQIKREKMLKSLIMRIHEGEDLDSVKEDFKKHFSNVSSFEIAEMERNLIEEGMEVEEVQKLCSIHASLFEGSIEKIYSTNREEESIGHPIKVIREENYAIANLVSEIEDLLEVYLNSEDEKDKINLLVNTNLLFDIDKHYMRKENVIFPFMEKYGITAPPKVMWGVDDEIREMLKSFKESVTNDEKDGLKERSENLFSEIRDMITKEEEIMIPLILDRFTEDDFIKIMEDSDEIGYCLVSPKGKWQPKRIAFLENKSKDEEEDTSNIKFDIGFLSPKELETILNSLPIDITFIDDKDTVKYFNAPEKKIFPRTKSVIGRNVVNCHPPKSVDTVSLILNDFKSGKKDQESFWIDLKGMFVYITYFAIRDENGKYMGTLEVTQDVKTIRDLEGEKRIL